MSERDLPEGVIDADPPGGWESDQVIDGESQQRNADAYGSADLVGSEEVSSDEVTSDDPAKGADPDLSTGGDE